MNVDTLASKIGQLLMNERRSRVVSGEAPIQPGPDDIIQYYRERGTDWVCVQTSAGDAFEVSVRQMVFATVDSDASTR